MTTGPWRTPSGHAPIAPFRSPQELIDAVIDHVVRAIDLAIAQRVRAGEISDRGDAASTYFLDPARIRTLVHGPAEPAPELERAALAAARRDQGFLAQLAASAHALGRAFERWALTDDDRRIVLVLVAAGLSSRVGRLLAVLGGDPTAPAVTVDAVAAVLAPGDAGVRRLADRVGCGPLEAFALVQVGRPELPFARRPIAPAPRLLELAFDRFALDPTCGAVAIDGSYRTVAAPVREAVRAVLHRGLCPVVGSLAAEHDGIGALAAAIGEAERVLLLAPLAGILDPSRRAGLVREAMLLDGALAIELDAQSGVIAGAAIERICARVATFLVYTPDATPPRLIAASVTIPADLPGTAEIDAAVARSFGASHDRQAGPLVPHHPLAIVRAAEALTARGASAAHRDALVPTIVDQILPVAPARAIRLSGDKPPYRGDDMIDRVIQRWRGLDGPRRLAVLVCGVRGIGKARLAAAIAYHLEIQAFQLDRSGPIAAPLVEAIDAGAAVAVLRDLTEEEIRGLRSNSWWARARGLLVVTTTKRLEPGDTSDFDFQFRLEAPTARERAVLWATALATRNATIEPTALHDLARFPLSEHRIATLVRTTSELTLASLVMAIQRELGGADKPSERSP
jgi:winged helix domain-containing protein